MGRSVGAGLGRVLASLCIAFASALVVAACSTGEAPALRAVVVVGEDAGDVADAAIDVVAVWPTTPSDAALPDAGGPTFGAEGGAPATTFACTGKTGAAGDSTLSFASAGGMRDAIVHVPTAYDPTRGAMLVLNFHGFGSNAPEQVLLTGMSQAADARGFLVVYPDGIASSWNAGTCCGDAWTNSVDDVAFTKDLLARLGASYCIDPARIYATGMSNGGFFSHRLGCEMADVFAAIAPVAGVLGIDPSQCMPARPVPVLDFHGTSDPLVPYNGGPAASGILGQGLSFQSVAQTDDTWRSRDGCARDSVIVFTQGDATCAQFDGCAGSAELVQCTIAGGGHTWPGGFPVPPLGKTSTDISATSTMLDFFVAHPLER